MTCPTDFEGIVNFRDFGGHTTADGARVRRGRLFRSGSLAEMSAAERERFADLDVGVICDLRRAEERLEEPTPLPEHDPRREHIPIDPGSAISLRRSLGQTRLGVDERVQFMIEINRELARDHVADYRRMLRILLDEPERGFLVHCAAGKDRTGFGVAIVLRALGVPWEAVLEDYLASNERIDWERRVLPRLRAQYPDVVFDPDEVRALSGVRAEYLTAAFETVDATFGSFESYLRDALELDGKPREILRERFLE